MLMKTKYILVVTIAWLVVAGLIIIPRLIFKQPIATIATNATNADIVNAIYSLKDTIYSIQNTIYTATAIGVGVILAVITRK
ncbi:hypothetical protein ES708_19340 [subsurface metagenome]